MNQRFPKLPPLTSLRGFEAAARLGSFSRAADELFLTQSAVSHQIRVLEEHFEQPLFRRVGRSVVLTDAGVDFYETTIDVLQGLNSGSRRLTIYARPNSVVVYTSQGLASRWLTPRLPVLRQQHSEIEPWLAVFHSVPELDSAETHLAISTSGEYVPGWVSDALFSDAVIPLCHPDLHEQVEHDGLAEYLDRHHLLHDETPTGWSDWSAAMDVPIEDTLSGSNFSEPGLALDAAVYKQGIVLGSIILALRDISSKQLLPLSYFPFPTGETYHLHCREESLKTSAVAAMRDWLLQEACDTRKALEGMNLTPHHSAPPKAKR